MNDEMENCIKWNTGKFLTNSKDFPISLTPWYDRNDDNSRQWKRNFIKKKSFQSEIASNWTIVGQKAEKKTCRVVIIR